MEGEKIRSILGRGVFAPSGPFFELCAPPEELFANVLPRDYLDLVTEIEGREGFIGTAYIRFYRYQELIGLNQAFQIATYNPELFIFASDGHGEAYAFCIRGSQVVKIPLIPIPTDQAEVVADSFAGFVRTLADSGDQLMLDGSSVGLEVHLIKPLCFGGDWRDPTNVILVDPLKYSELVRYWNALYRSLTNKQSNSN